ncbi:SixA phosphatase family protein [Tomitella cavernea]|uniref:SixA phosphatase family protein n=1 Tax=Tomitella cavernea TaxID=1387982 RepID=UPI0019089DE7|nr:histidine phosphatase family protein [Tomitella cavernea]
MSRTLILLRHGQAAPAAGAPDHDRPLTEHGAAQAEAAGEWIAAHGWQVGAALCSTAVRTRETLRAVAVAAGWSEAAVACSAEPALYDAGVDDVLDAIAPVGDDVDTLVVVGHFPGLPRTALTLAPSGPLTDQVRDGMPTGACIAIATDAAWSALPDVLRGTSDPYGTITAVLTP